MAREREGCITKREAGLAGEEDAGPTPALRSSVLCTRLALGCSLEAAVSLGIQVAESRVSVWREACCSSS